MSHILNLVKFSRSCLRRVWTSLVRCVSRRPVVVESIKGHVEARGDSVIVCYRNSSKYYNLRLPEMEGTVDHLFQRCQKVTLFPTYLTKISDVMIRGKSGLLLVDELSVSLEHAHWFRNLFETNIDARPGWRRPRMCIDGPAYSLFGLSPGAHYHMLSDFGAKLVRDWKHLPQDIRFIFPENTSRPVLDFFEALGIPPTARYLAPRNRDLIFKELYWSPPSTMSGFNDPEELESIRRIVWKNLRLNEESNIPYLLLYVTRRDSNRRIANEDEIESQVLRPAGFETVELSKLTFAQQADLFYRAKLIVTAHGAGLVNLIFSRNNTDVVELFSDPLPNGGTCYWSIASLLGMRYRYLVGRTVPPHSSYSDFIIDASQLAEMIADLQGKTR